MPIIGFGPVVPFPVLSCRVGFGSNPFDAVQVATEIGPASGAGPGGHGWLRSLTTKRGRERLLRSSAQFQAGSSAAVFDNRDRRFDPTNTAGPYYPNVQPEKWVQYGATWAGTFYPIWTGFIDDWAQSWPGFSEGAASVPATDLFKSLAIKRLNSSGYAADVLAGNPSAYYRLGTDPSDPGSDVIDSSPNHNNGTWMGTPKTSSPGALIADSDGFLDCSTTSPGRDPLNFSVGGVNSVPTGAAIILPPPVWSPQFNDPTVWMITFWANFTQTTPTTNPSSLLFAPNVGPNIQEANGCLGLFTHWFSTPLNDSKWHRIDIRFRLTGGGANWTQDISIDGGAQGTTISGVVVVPGLVQPPILGTYPGNPASLWLGNMDEVAVYQGAAADTAWARASAQYHLGVWPSESSGQRINRILDSIGFPSGLRRVDTGRTTVIPETADITQAKVLQYTQHLEQSEQGQHFVRADGAAVFEDRYHRYIYPNAQPQAIFGDGGGAEIPYNMGGVILNFDRAELFNEIPVTARGGSTQIATNPTSIAQFTARTMPGLSDLLLTSDPQALYCAQWILGDTAFPQFRIGSLILNPVADARLWPLILGLDIGAVIVVNKHNIPGGGPSISLTCRIEGIEHQIDPPRAWKTTWHVSLAGTIPWLILDDPVAGQLDVGNRWGW